jgi:hypothetical protein
MKLRNAIIVLISLLSAYNVPYAQPDPGRFDSFLGTDWYGIYMQGAKVGYGELQFEKADAPVAGWRTRESLTMILSLMGKIDTMKIVDERYYLSPGGELYSNKMKFGSVTGDMMVEGAKEADEYIVTITLGGQETKKTFDYPADYLDNLKKPNLMIAEGVIAVGDSLKSSYFEVTPPLTGVVHTDMKVESVDEYNFNGVPTEVYTISFMIPEMQFSGVSIIDKSGRELELNLGGGILLRLEGHDQAIKIDEEYDILQDNLVRPQSTIEDPGSLKSLKLRITGIGENDILKTDQQKISLDADNAITADITKPDIPAKTIDLPIRSEEMELYLVSTVYIQSDAEEIKSLAKEIVGDEKNSWEAAKKINRWVYDNIEKQFTPDFSNALQTLHTRRGDCGEHSVLTVALMRAVGIPARPVAGLVYWPPGNGFGYHAWVEAFVGQWVMMDPAWGEDLINPTHIALVRGDIIDQAGVLYRVMGRMGIEVAEAR